MSFVMRVAYFVIRKGWLTQHATRNLAGSFDGLCHRDGRISECGADTPCVRLTCSLLRARMPLTNERLTTSTGNSTRHAMHPASRGQCELDQQANAEPTLESPPKPGRKA